MKENRKKLGKMEDIEKMGLLAIYSQTKGRSFLKKIE